LRSARRNAFNIRDAQSIQNTRKPNHQNARAKHTKCVSWAPTAFGGAGLSRAESHGLDPSGVDPWRSVFAPRSILGGVVDAQDDELIVVAYIDAIHDHVGGPRDGPFKGAVNDARMA
jgi:hypothetical protein